MSFDHLTIEINTGEDDPFLNDHPLTHYQELQRRAKEKGIKANLRGELLELLLAKLDRGEEIDPQYYRGGLWQKITKNPVQKGMTAGGGLLVGFIIGYLVGGA